MEIRKEDTFLWVINQPINYKFFKDFTNHKQKTKRAVGFSCRLFPNFLNTGTTDETFKQSGKQDSFRLILKSSASMYKSSSLQFFRTTTGTQSGPDAFDESRFVMTFLSSWKLKNIMEFQISSKRESRLVLPTIPDKILGTKWSNPVKLDRKRKVWYLFLRGS